MSVRTTYREAVKAAIVEAIERDPLTFLMGEDVGRYGGCYAVTKGLFDRFGPARIRDAPLSELGFVGAGIGAAVAGARPIVEVMTVNFALLALDQIVNVAATLSHMSGGQLHVPVVIRIPYGAGRQVAAQHSHSFEGWFAHIPGITVAAPGTLEDARGMLLTALEQPDPVVLFEHVMLYNLEGELPDGAEPVDLLHAAVRREGHDVTLAAWGGMVPRTIEAANALAALDIDAEVLDLRVLRPLDEEALLQSVAKTRRLVIVDEEWKSGSFSAELAARVAEKALYDLDAPVRRVCSAEVPIPYAKHLEDAALPQVPAIVAAAEEVMGRG